MLIYLRLWPLVTVAVAVTVTVPVPPLTRIQNHPLVLPASNVFQGLVEMFFTRLNRRRFLLVARQVGVDQFDESVEIFRRHLFC